MAGRYAIYFAPEAGSALAGFGATALGYDVATGNTIPHWADLPVEASTWTQWTQSPRRYGFHATLKAPFVLKKETREDQLIAAARNFASTRRGFSFDVQVAVLGTFVALVPTHVSPDINALAADCVIAFDRFRAPPTPEERARRLAHPLNEKQRACFERWGYPYVFDEFRFHMSLTDSLSVDERTAARAFLAERFAALGEARVTVAGLSLFRQDDEGSRFRILEQMPFGS